MSIGIISGAGPMAGVELLKKIIVLSQERGAFRDRDFPEIHLINIPFSEMLAEDFDSNKITKELSYGFNKLSLCSSIAIACQTAHLFLPETIPTGFINLFPLIKENLPKDKKPIVIASRTAVRNKLHDRLLEMECDYYDAEESQATIDAILRGESVDLNWINELDNVRPIILGCTEYSLPQASIVLNKNVIDPIAIAAQKIVDKLQKLKNCYRRDDE